MRSVASLALVALTGCSADASSALDPVAPPESASAEPAAASGEYLVWGSEDTPSADGESADRQPRELETFVLASDGLVKELLPFAAVAVSGNVYRWSVRPVEYRRAPCHADFVADGLDTETVALLRSMAESEAQELAREPTRTVSEASVVELHSGRANVVSRWSDDGMQDVTFVPELVATVGRFAFVREYGWSYACGAHGNYGTVARVIDMSTASDVDLGSELDAADLAQARDVAGRSFAEMRKEWLADDEPDPFDSETSFVELVPSYDENARLSFDARFTTFAPYAFSTGWAGYAIDTKAPLFRSVPRLPAVDAPAPVVAFARAHRGWTLGGFSVR